MIFLLFFILIAFTLVLAFVWTWFFKNEAGFCDKFYSSALKEFESGQYEKAEALFSRILALVPKFKDVRYRLGLTYLKLKDFDKAKLQFEQALESSPTDFNILSNLALTFQSAGNSAEAEIFYAKALQENQKDPNCCFGLGLAKFEQKNYQEALEYFTKANELSPDNSLYSFYINKCNDEACDYYDETQVFEVINNYISLSTGPDVPKGVNLSIAIAYAKLGQIEPAETYCKKAIAQNPEDVECYKILGLVQLVKKDYELTKTTLKTALSLQPKNEELHNLLSYGLCHQLDSCALEECREKYFALVKGFLK